MRLICPNCSAQYEVDPGIIPEEGRDVQCSNCGTTWFELPTPAVEPSEAAEPEIAHAAPEPQPEPEPAPEPEVAAEPEPVEEVVAEADPEPEPHPSEPRDEWRENDWTETRDNFDQPKRPRDIASVDILKEEAAREIDQRRGETSASLETQGDLGLAAPAPVRDNPSRALRARQARMKSEDQAQTDAPEEDDYQAPRRDLLPDIEEINSSLGPGKKGSPEAVAANQRGFRYGFLVTAGGALLAIAAYAWAPAIAEAVPGSEGALLGYVDWANGVRDTLDRFISGVSGG